MKNMIKIKDGEKLAHDYSKNTAQFLYNMLHKYGQVRNKTSQVSRKYLYSAWGNVQCMGKSSVQMAM